MSLLWCLGSGESENGQARGAALQAADISADKAIPEQEPNPPCATLVHVGASGGTLVRQ